METSATGAGFSAVAWGFSAKPAPEIAVNVLGRFRTTAWKSRLAPWVPVLARVDRVAYVLWAALTTIVCARSFYGYMLKQTGGEWSAPLDDVFIHFDYARATALGHPFEWVVGNGYSSGNTSLLYPFVLAIGWLVGFREQRLMVWAAVVAMMCVFGTLLVVRRLFLGMSSKDDAWARISSYLAAPFLLGIGALNWSFWSGMEVAIFVATWAISLATWLDLDRLLGQGGPPSARRIKRGTWLLGLSGALMIVTRPEATGTIAVFGLAVALRLVSRGRLAALLSLVRVGLPGGLVVVVQALANRALTGELSANGAIVKLAMNSPFLTADEKLGDYLFNLRYAVLRNVEYHFADQAGYGIIIPALALLAVAMPETRRYALILWAQIGMWLLLVAMNGQVRWQNERYTMPAVAWLLVIAALGVSGLLRGVRGRPNVALVTVVGALAFQVIGIATRPSGTAPEFRFSWLLAVIVGMACAAFFHVRVLRMVACLALVFVAYDHQVPKMRDQRWFFGRACRNIRDQHIVMGRWLRTQHPRRVLVGDAGAILYASDARGLDIIGLGGYHEYPFARAGVQGLPATLELIERMPQGERPDILAIFPTWWGVLPTWFSSGVMERFPVEGNVICGGYEHVAYKADWHTLGVGDRIRALPDGDVKVVDEVDVADLVSEKAHKYEFPRPAGGWTDMHILPDPANPRVDMFDGGRRLASGRSEHFTMRNLVPGKAAHLVFRTAPEGKSKITVLLAGQEVGKLAFERYQGWIEVPLGIDAGMVTSGELSFEVKNDGPEDFVNYHVWLTE
jgi:hypothetical protein